MAQILAHIDYLDEAIASLSARIERVIAPFSEQVALRATIPGAERRTAEILVAELSADMAQFPSAAHLGKVGRDVPEQQRVGPVSTARVGPARTPSGCARR